MTIRRTRMLYAVLGGAFAALFARGARAQSLDGGVSERRFVWARQAGAELCPSEQELRQKVTALVGGDPFVRSDGPIVRGVVRREAGMLIATLSLREKGEPAKSRELHTDAGSCAALADAVALAIALSIERLPVEGPAARAPESPTDRAPVLDRAETERDERRRNPARWADRAWSTLAQAHWTLGSLPRPTTGLGVALRYRMSDRILGAVGGLWLPPADERGQFTVGLTSARLGACVESLRASPFALAHCAYGMLGAVQVKRDAATVSEAGTHPWYAASMTTAASARLSESWVAEAGVEGTVPLTRPTYLTTECPTVGFQEPVATLGLFLSLGMLFP